MEHDGSARLFLVTGIMAAGKSTVAEALAQRFRRGVHVRGDVFRRFVVRGREEMTLAPTAEALAQLTLRYELAAGVADRYARAGFTVVLQDVVLGPQLDVMVHRLATRPLHVVVLAPRAEVVAAREAGRGKVGYRGMSPTELDEAFRADTPRLGLWLDTSDLTVEETVDAVLDRLDESLVS